MEDKTIDIITNSITAVAAIFFITGSIVSMVVVDRYIYGWFYIFGSVLFMVPPILNLVKICGYI